MMECNECGTNISNRDWMSLPRGYCYDCELKLFSPRGGD